jgi:hypothetical protein
MSKNKVYTFDVNDDLGTVLQAFTEKLNADEEIQSITESGNKLIVCTKVTGKRNLLLEEVQKRSKKG